ncbi:VC0807 family protein [Microlunatus soli]|uniref:Intracellular septation protein A n=1 Tax=Microlunatus soli TaxID=630515 RepID=A0A1H1NMA7_9ACTN|nr:VC0807 family protein [Microlunatus soli]SDR99459.1 Intracellular septation protein A [Microlunatus soli]
MDRRQLIMKLLPDIAVPAVIYFLLRAVDIAPAYALLAAAVYSIGRVGYVAIRRHRLNLVGCLVGAGVLIGGLLTLITGDPRFLMARESVVSGALGLILLVSWAIRRPAIFALVRTMNSDRPEAVGRLDQLWDGRPDFRHAMMVMTAVWGCVALAESVLRIVLVYLLPLDVMAAVSVALQLGSTALLICWTVWYRKLRGRPDRPVSDAAATPGAPQLSTTSSVRGPEHDRDHDRVVHR